MRKLLFSILLLAICFSDTKAQYGGGPCPGGQQSIGVSLHITMFNFHRARYNCDSHFGICVRGYLSPICPQTRSTIVPGVSSDGLVTGYGTFLTNDSKGTRELELHLPVEMKASPSFKNQDMDSFEVTDDMLFVGDPNGTVYEKVVGGLYRVKEVNSELVIVVKTVKTTKN
jgi:hypothetical protein